mgnify:CR=1|tara:strand:- start:68338 stop:68532 length:195 start_codon:yes stop_codon:yes gene_type:complete
MFVNAALFANAVIAVFSDCSNCCERGRVDVRECCHTGRNKKACPDSQGTLEKFITFVVPQDHRY